ncbi:MAG: tetratricopeptide repeat protein, partial [candidate division Zixibacteria bacterium]|nr:tetratricopeptide repeat protein [candidate division Zixibacteria bacterium]
MYRKFALALFLLLVILSLVFALKDDREVTTSSALAYSYYQEGIVLYEQLYFREACGYFEKAVREDSNFVMALCRLSGCYHQLGFRDKGKEAWERAYSLKEQVSDREQLLLDLWQAGDGADTAATRQLAEEYLERYPDYRDGYSTLAGLEARIDNYEAAIEYYLEALAVDPGFAMAHNMLGYFNYYLGRYDDALAHLEEYSRLAPNQANPHDSRGEILHAIGRYNEAIAEFRKAFNVNPDFAYAVEHMADSYLALGKKSQIDNCFGTLIDQSPSKRKRNDFYVHWGRTLSKQQEYDSAAAMFDNVLCGDPENLNALYYLGINYYLQRDLKNVTITFDSLRVVTDLRTEKEPALKESRELKRAITLTEAMTADLSGELEESAR